MWTKTKTKNLTRRVPVGSVTVVAGIPLSSPTTTKIGIFNGLRLLDTLYVHIVWLTVTLWHYEFLCLLPPPLPLLLLTNDIWFLFSVNPGCGINEVCLACHQITKRKKKSPVLVGSQNLRVWISQKEWYLKTELSKFVHLFYFNKLREKNLNN